MTERAELEPTPERSVIDYEAYRRVVDALSPAFRKVGVVDAAGYDRAMRDPRTVRLSIGTLQMPFLAPLEHASGYDVGRSQRLTGQEEVYVMAMPLGVLTAPDVKILGDDTEFDASTSAIIIETDHAETADTQQILPEALAGLGAYEPRDFLDERIRNPAQQSAMMAMYETHLEAIDDTGEPLPHRGTDYYQAYEELVAGKHPVTEHTKLFRVDELRDNEALVDDLWDLCSDRFDWLGDQHPVSMEDTKDFFVQMILNDDTHTIVRYDDEGKPVCLGFFMSGFDKSEWIRPGFRAAVLDRANTNDEEILYFDGIASKSQEAAHYGRDVMQLLSRIIQQRGGSYHLMFESTNMSSRYIPRMVSQYTQGQGVQLDPIVRTAQIDYWYLEPVGQQPTSD